MRICERKGGWLSHSGATCALKVIALAVATVAMPGLAPAGSIVEIRPQNQVDKDTSTPAIGNKFEGCVITNSGGAGIRVNDASCVNNFVSASKFLNNLGGSSTEAVPGLLKHGDMASN